MVPPRKNLASTSARFYLCAGPFATLVGRPARKVATLATVASSSRRRASRVAQAMCGVIRQLRADSTQLPASPQHPRRQGGGVG